MATPRWERTAPRWLPALAARLDRDFTDHERVWSVEWLKKKRPTPATTLVRHLAFASRTPAAHARMLAHLASLDARDVPPLAVFSYQNFPNSRAELSQVDAAMLLGQLAHAPLHTIELTGGATPGTLWQALCAADAPRPLRALTIESHAPDGPLSALLGSSLLREVRSLSLGWGARPGSEAAATLGARASHLERFTATSVFREADVVASLARREWPALRHLAVASALGVVAPELGPWLDHAPALESFALSSHQHPETVETLLADRRAPELTSLDVSFNRLNAAMLARILASPFAARVRTLRLGGSTADEGVARAVLRLPLESLDVAQVRDDGFWRAMQGQRLPQLRALTVGHTLEPGDGAVTTAATLDLPALESLALDCARLTQPMLDALERAPFYPRLRTILRRHTVPAFDGADTAQRFDAMNAAILSRARDSGAGAHARSSELV